MYQVRTTVSVDHFFCDIELNYTGVGLINYCIGTHYIYLTIYVTYI